MESSTVENTEKITTIVVEGNKNLSSSISCSTDENGQAQKRESTSFRDRQFQVRSIRIPGGLSEKEINFEMVVEELRFTFLIFFDVIILLGIVLTKLFTAYFVPGDIGKPLYDTFGVVSICVYFDYPPATYILPTFYAVELFFMYIYAIAMIFRAWIAKEEKKIKGKEFGCFTFALVYFALSGSFFSTIFAVQPNPEIPRTISVHTLPYTNLMIALCVLQVAVTWFGVRVSWEELKAPMWMRIASYGLIVGGIITTTVKVLCQINALTYFGHGSMWTVSNETANRVLKVHDFFWLTFALIFPTIQSGYLTFYDIFYNKDDIHTLLISMTDNQRTEKRTTIG